MVFVDGRVVLVVDKSGFWISRRYHRILQNAVVVFVECRERGRFQGPFRKIHAVMARR